MCSCNLKPVSEIHCLPTLFLFCFLSSADILFISLFPSQALMCLNRNFISQPVTAFCLEAAADGSDVTDPEKILPDFTLTTGIKSALISEWVQCM